MCNELYCPMTLSITTTANQIHFNQILAFKRHVLTRVPEFSCYNVLSKRGLDSFSFWYICRAGYALLNKAYTVNLLTMRCYIKRHKKEMTENSKITCVITLIALQIKKETITWVCLSPRPTRPRSHHTPRDLK